MADAAARDLAKGGGQVWPSPIITGPARGDKGLVLPRLAHGNGDKGKKDDPGHDGHDRKPKEQPVHRDIPLCLPREVLGGRSAKPPRRVRAEWEDSNRMACSGGPAWRSAPAVRLLGLRAVRRVDADPVEGALAVRVFPPDR